MIDLNLLRANPTKMVAGSGYTSFFGENVTQVGVILHEAFVNLIPKSSKPYSFGTVKIHKRISVMLRNPYDGFDHGALLFPQDLFNVAHLFLHFAV